MHSTFRPTVPSGIVNSMLSATVGTWSTIHTFTVDYWLGALNRGATPFDLARDLATWTAELSDRQRPPWAHEHRIVEEWPLARLRDYSTPDADPGMVATVILPPQAGHDSSIVDFAERQSQIITGRENGCHRIYSLDWVGATQETKDAGIDDYMSMLRETAEMLGGKVNLVGDCQGGWLATIFTALYPEKVNSLALAGAPIDFHAGEPLIHDWLTVLAPEGDMSFFRSAVDANDGLLPGRFLLDGFKNLEPDQELARKLQLLTNLDDTKYVDRYRKFENWFQWTQSLPGEFYLWVVEHLFIRNSLIKGELVVEGRTVDLKAIDCPIFLMAGLTDHITPPDQVWAIADYVSTPAARIGRQSSTSGHLGLFMSRDALQSHWPVIFEEMAALSTPTRNDIPDVLTDEPTQSQPTAWGLPAPEEASEKAPEEPAKAAKTPAPKAMAPARDTSSPRTARKSAQTTTESLLPAVQDEAPAQRAETGPSTEAPTTAAPKADEAKTAAPAKTSTSRTPRKTSGTTRKSTSGLSSTTNKVPARKSPDRKTAATSDDSSTSSTRSRTTKQSSAKAPRTADNSASDSGSKTDSSATEPTGSEN